MTKISITFGLTALAVFGLSHTALSEPVTLVQPDHAHGSFKHLRDHRQCPSHCYNHHKHIRKHSTDKLREEMTEACITVCGETLKRDPALRQNQPIPANRRR